MNINSIKSIIVAGSLATGLLSTAVAASAAQPTAPAPAADDSTKIVAATTPLMPNNGNVSVSTGTTQESRKDAMQRRSDEARRIEFRNQGTSL